MRNKEGKINQVTRNLTIFVSFVILCLIATLGINVISQNTEKANNKFMVEQSQTGLQNSDKETQQLIEVLKKREESAEVIFAAIKTLGDKKAKEAIPELIKYLNYEKVYAYKQSEYAGGVKIDGTEIGRTIPISGRYPATGALFKIGEPALPALVKVIEEEESNSVRSQNALYAIQQVFVEDGLKAVLYLEKTIPESLTPNGSKRLQLAAKKTKEKWDALQKILSN